MRTARHPGPHRQKRSLLRPYLSFEFYESSVQQVPASLTIKRCPRSYSGQSNMTRRVGGGAALRRYLGRRYLGGSVVLVAIVVATLGMIPGLAQAVQDTTPPVLASLTILPTSVDTSGGPAMVTSTAHITDDVSGFA